MHIVIVESTLILMKTIADKCQGIHRLSDGKVKNANTEDAECDFD